MATSYGALCSDFYISSRLNVKMDLPEDRQTILDLLDRIRREEPSMERFRRYEDELALESRHRDDGRQKWVALRKTSLRAGVVHPESTEEAAKFHRFLLEVAPFFLSISPLDVDLLEVVYGFDLEAPGNHNQIVHDAFLSGSPLAELIDHEKEAPIDVQPIVAVALTKRCETQAHFEIKTRTSTREIRTKRYRNEPISVYLTVRRYGAMSDMKDAPAVFSQLHEKAEELAQERIVPHVLTPLREAIASARF